MTLILGIRCTDGVIIGSDSAVTFGPSPQQPTIEQPSSKIDVITGEVIVATTGFTGHGFRVVHEIGKIWNGKALSGKDICDAACHITQTVQGNFASTRAAGCGALVALPLKGKAELIEFESSSFQPDVKHENLWYASMGSGQFVADTLLGFVRKVFWGNSPPKRQDGVFAATLVLSLGCEMAPNGVNGPMQLAILEQVPKGKGTEWKARLVSREELLEHEQNVKEAFKHWREYESQLQKSAQGQPTPTPASK